MRRPWHVERPKPGMPSVDRFLNDFDLHFCQAVQLINELVNLPVDRIDLIFKNRLSVGGVDGASPEKGT
jgi:hypothetical protein